MLILQEVIDMIGSHELRQRDSYLNKLIGFQDTEPVKVITGIRRCGSQSVKADGSAFEKYRCSSEQIS